MFKGLRQAGQDAEREQRQREREARAARARATKKALVAMAEMEPLPDELAVIATPSTREVQRGYQEFEC